MKKIGLLPFYILVRGWKKPKKRIHEFLENLNKAGGTHHSIFIYNTSAEQMQFFGELLGL